MPNHKVFYVIVTYFKFLDSNPVCDASLWGGETRAVLQVKAILGCCYGTEMTIGKKPCCLAYIPSLVA